MPSDDHLIRDLHSTWIHAINTGDLPRLLTLMTDDALFLTPGHAPLGRDEFSAVFQSAHQHSRLHCISELKEIVIVGHLAYTRSHDTVSVTPLPTSTPTGHPASTIHLTGDRLTIYQKHNGHWLLARDAHTLTPLEKPPTS